MVLFLKNILDDRGKHSAWSLLRYYKRKEWPQCSCHWEFWQGLSVMVWHNACKEHLGYWHIMSYKSLLSQMTRKENILSKSYQFFCCCCSLLTLLHYILHEYWHNLLWHCQYSWHNRLLPQNVSFKLSKTCLTHLVIKPKLIQTTICVVSWPFSR